MGYKIFWSSPLLTDLEVVKIALVNGDVVKCIQKSSEGLVTCQTNTALKLK